MDTTQAALILSTDEDDRCTLLDTECVQLYEDGHLGIGTDGQSTTPSGPTDHGELVATFRPDRAGDPWDCWAGLAD